MALTIEQIKRIVASVYANKLLAPTRDFPMTLSTEQMKRLADSVRNGSLGPSPKRLALRKGSTSPAPKPAPNPAKK